MNLHKKTIIIIFVTFVILLMISYSFSQVILLDSYKELENEKLSNNLQRIFNTLEENGITLESQVLDWGIWDASYDFMQGIYENYISENFPDESFTNLKINLVSFVNISGIPVYTRAFDLQQKQEIPIPQDFEEHISVGSPLLNVIHTKEATTGYILLNDTPFLVSSGPILPTSGEGAAIGALIMGRYLDKNEIGFLNNLTQLSFTIYRCDDQQLPEDVQFAIASLPENEGIFIQPFDDESITGFMYLTDIYGNTSFIIRLEMIRSVYLQGQKTINYFFLFIIASDIAIGFAVLILLEKTIIYRLDKLSNNIKKIALQKDPTKRLTKTSKNDEIATLIHTINMLLEEKQKYEDDLKKSSDVVNDINKQLKEKIEELEKFKKLTVDRELRMIELKKKIEELEGRKTA